MLLDLNSFSSDISWGARLDPYLSQGYPLYGELFIHNLNYEMSKLLHQQRYLTVSVYASYQGNTPETEPLADSLIYNGYIRSTTRYRLNTPDYIDKFFCFVYPSRPYVSLMDNPPKAFIVRKASLSEQVEQVFTEASPEGTLLPDYSYSGTRDFSIGKVVRPDHYQPVANTNGLVLSFAQKNKISIVVNPLRKYVHIAPLYFTAMDAQDIINLAESTPQYPYISAQTGRIGWVKVDVSGLVSFSVKLDPTLHYGDYVRVDLSDAEVTGIKPLTVSNITQDLVQLALTENTLVKILRISYDLSSWGTEWHVNIVGMAPDFVKAIGEITT